MTKKKPNPNEALTRVLDHFRTHGESYAGATQDEQLVRDHFLSDDDDAAAGAGDDAKGGGEGKPGGDTETK